jgi:hypothetical protein
VGIARIMQCGRYKKVRVKDLDSHAIKALVRTENLIRIDCNHAPDIAAMDLFVVPTTGFDLLYVLVVVRLARRDLVWINVTSHPTAEWIARQITEAFPWNEAPRYLIRDRDQIYGAAAMRRLRTMGIRDKPVAPGSPW